MDSTSSFKTLADLKGVSMGSLNVRSLFKNLDEVSILLEESKLKMLLLQETFLNYAVADPIIDIEGYNITRQDRTSDSGKKGGGGLCHLLKPKLRHTPCGKMVVLQS